jgi:hypothetical protein
MTHGASLRANVNTALAFFSDSPSHLFSTDDASTLKKLAPPSVATALASMVFPGYIWANKHKSAAENGKR